MKILQEKCKKCLSCVDICPVTAISNRDNTVTINPDVCLDCGCCKASCPHDAIEYD